MLSNRLRWIAFVALCGGTVFQTASTGCDALLAPIISMVVSSVVTGIVNNMLLAT